MVLVAEIHSDNKMIALFLLVNCSRKNSNLVSKTVRNGNHQFKQKYSY